MWCNKCLNITLLQLTLTSLMRKGYYYISGCTNSKMFVPSLFVIYLIQLKFNPLVLILVMLSLWHSIISGFHHWWKII